MAYSEIIKDTGNKAKDEDPSNVCIRLKNLKKFILCVLKLGLCSSPEMMLDYSVDKLAQATAEKCLEWAGIKDKSKGVITLEMFNRFIETSN